MGIKQVSKAAKHACSAVIRPFALRLGDCEPSHPLSHHTSVASFAILGSMVSRIAVASRSRFDILQQDEIEQSDPEDDTNDEIESAAGVIKSDMMCAPYSNHFDAVLLILWSFARATPAKIIQTQPVETRITKDGETSDRHSASNADGVPAKSHDGQRIMLEAPGTEARTDSASEGKSHPVTVCNRRSSVT